MTTRASDVVGPVTQTVATLPPGPAVVLLARLDGHAVGDTAAADPLTVELSGTRADGCPAPAPVRLDVTGLAPASFAGWATTPARLVERIDAYQADGQVDPATSADLRALVPAEVTTAGQLNDFLSRLSDTTPDEIHDEARARLASLAARLNA